MDMRRRNLFSLSGGLLLVAAIGYYWGMDRRAPTPDLFSETGSRPDYQAWSLYSRETNEQGQLARELRADTLVHYAQPEQAQITRPELQLYDNNQPAWKITAAEGQLSAPEAPLHFSGGVRADRLGVATSHALSLETATLAVQPKTGQLDTNDEVLVRGAAGHTLSDGLSADLQQGHYELKGRIRGEYRPSQKEADRG